MAPTGNEMVEQALNEIDQAANQAGTRVQALIDDINRTAAEGLTGPQTENVLARLATFKAWTNALAANPTQPIPPTPPTEPPMPGPFA